MTLPSAGGRPGRPWQPAASLAALRARAALNADLRAFFARRGVLEVETAAFSWAAGPDPSLAPVAARIAGREGFLQTSPEFAMKRLLAAGSGDIYQLARVFRDDESGRHHNPEFTLLEWYRLGFDHHRLMAEVASLLSELLPRERFPAPARMRTFEEVLRSEAGIDAASVDVAALHAALAEHEVPWPASLAGDREALLDLLLGEVVGPALGHAGPDMVYDYPPGRAALARVHPGPPARAERFEVYLAGVELANGFHELTDAQEQRRRFEAELAVRRRLGLAQPALDEALLAALDHGLPACAGVALGVDRLLMIMLGAQRLDEVLAFPIARA